MFTSVEEVFENALEAKLQADENIRLGDSLYLCLECHQVTDYWKPGGVCGACEARGERQQEDEHDQN